MKCRLPALMDSIAEPEICPYSAPSAVIGPGRAATLAAAAPLFHTSTLSSLCAAPCEFQEGSQLFSPGLVIRCLSTKSSFALFFLGTKQKKRLLIWDIYSTEVILAAAIFFLYLPTRIPFDNASLILIIKRLMHKIIKCIY